MNWLKYANLACPESTEIKSITKSLSNLPPPHTHTAGTESHDRMHSGKFCVLITLSLLNKYLVSAIFPEDWEVQKKKETKSKLERNWSFICDDGRFQGISECMQTYMVIKRRQSQ